MNAEALMTKHEPTRRIFLSFVINHFFELRHSTFDICHLPHSSFVIHTGAMLDIRLIREKPDFVRERLAARGDGDEARIDEVLRIDAERRKSETELQRLHSER